MKQGSFPSGWDEDRVREVLAHYEAQTEDEAVAEDEAAFEDQSQTFMVIPTALVPKVRALIAALLPVGSMDEVFVCGPEAMIEATQKALLDAGVPEKQVHTERFTSPVLETLTPEARQAAVAKSMKLPAGGQVSLTVVLDGKSHALKMNPDQHVLDVAMAAGLDLPFSCKGGVCATCRCKVMSGSVAMVKNFGLEAWETDKGFVLSCQSRPTSEAVTVSFDER